MGTDGSTGDPVVRSPDDWPSEPERRYARRQARLAGHYSLDVDSLVIDTESAGRVHCLDAGNPGGEPVVLLHGLTGQAAYWLPIAPSLADRYRLYAPDMPGEGLSAKPSYRGRDLRAFMTGYLLDVLDALGLDRPHVVANSVGGAQAFLLAIDHGRVDRLCLVGAPVGVSRDFPLLARLLTVRGVNRLLLRAMDVGDPVGNARAWFRRVGVVDDAAIPEAFYDLYATRREIPGLRTSLRSFLTEVGSFGRIDPIADLRAGIVGIERPTAFVWGTGDYYWPPEVGRPLADRMPDATLHELPDHGHTPWLEPGEAAERRIRSFLDG